MDLLLRSIYQTNVSSLASSHRTSQSRSTSYADFQSTQSSPLDALIGLCAGRSAKLRLQRKKILEYFHSLTDMHESSNKLHDSDETCADLVSGSIGMERPSQHSLLKPWEEENDGINFRYRLPPTNSSTPRSCSSNRREYLRFASLVAKDEEQSLNHETILNSPSILNVPTTKISHTVALPFYLRLHKTSFPAAVLPSVIQTRAKRQVLDIASACAEGREIDLARKLDGNVQAAMDAVQGAARCQDQIAQDITTDLNSDDNTKASTLEANSQEQAKIEQRDVAHWKEICSNFRHSTPGRPRHCREFLLTANFNPLYITWQVDPKRLAHYLAKKKRAQHKQILFQICPQTRHHLGKSCNPVTRKGRKRAGQTAVCSEKKCTEEHIITGGHARASNAGTCTADNVVGPLEQSFAQKNYVQGYSKVRAKANKTVREVAVRRHDFKEGPDQWDTTRCIYIPERSGGYQWVPTQSWSEAELADF